MSIIVYDEFILLVIYLWKSSSLVTVYSGSPSGHSFILTGVQALGYGLDAQPYFYLYLGQITQALCALASSLVN